MIAQKVARFRRALWTWKQPLTRRPVESAVPVSDLFVWRNSIEWQTSFELMDIPGLFPDRENGVNTTATLVIFDHDGRRLLTKSLAVVPGRRQTINLSAFLTPANGEIGTFAVFHSPSPLVLVSMGSFLAERGYVSYLYGDAPLRSYVHGNLDAIAQGADDKLQLLGCSSFLRREYRLQYELHHGVTYELGVVNPTPIGQSCVCKLISVHSGKIAGFQRLKLAPGGVQLAVFRIDKSEPVRLVIESHLVMGRPLVFRIQNHKLDVFHG